MRRIARLLLPLLLLLFRPLTSTAQDDGRSQKEQEKILAKEEKKKKKEARRAEKELFKKHLERQDKATAKRIKRNQRKSDRRGPGGHRDPWIKRVFSKKRR